MAVLFQILSIDQLLSNLERLGFFQFILPFLLALAIFYGALQFALGDKIPKSARGLISLILAFFVMLFAAGNPQIVSFLKNISGGGMIIATGILMFVIFLAFFGKKPDEIIKGGDIGVVGWGIIFVIILITLGLFGGSIGTFLPFIQIGSDMMTILIFVLILAVALWWLGRGEGGEGEKKES